jgi:hypothetical protein
MKLIVPLVSSTPQATSSSEPMPCTRADSAMSSRVSRSRFRFRSMALPSWTTMTGSPLSSGRSRGKWKLCYENTTWSTAIVPIASSAPVSE